MANVTKAFPDWIRARPYYLERIALDDHLPWLEVVLLFSSGVPALIHILHSFDGRIKSVPARYSVVGGC